ncbi:hypothetical protein KSX_45210 [Ktedonospora formicarum]|uniref:Uncharacterized protein n=1 Tax=Ktedonospora formicarum TaxID=2778364 RepID=A0A8J3I3X0_9CHLR|nr:hypothetical protein KSX_45210 [Ktedonospora formicarum]
MKSKGRFRLFTIPITTLLLCGLAVGSLFFSAKLTYAASYCQVSYTITNQWQGDLAQTLQFRIPVPQHGLAGDWRLPFLPVVRLSRKAGMARLANQVKMSQW